VWSIARLPTRTRRPGTTRPSRSKNTTRETPVGATRRILIGREEGAADFIVRYFTIPAGGHSSLEQHRHQHGVVIVHGHGRVLLGDRWTEIGEGDAVYVEPDELHQFQADDEQPLGFICVIPAWAKAPMLPVADEAASQLAR
jgi:quercetin dioxygenase-like cupin family protein